MNDILTTLISARASSEAAAAAAPQLPTGDTAEFLQLLDRLAALAELPSHGGSPLPSATTAVDTATLTSKEAAADAEAAPQLANLPPDAAALAALVGQMQAAYLRPTASQTDVDSAMTAAELAAPPATPATTAASVPLAPAAFDLADTAETQSALVGSADAQTPAQPSQVAASTATLPNGTTPASLQETAVRIPMVATAPRATTETLPEPTAAAPTSNVPARSASSLLPVVDALVPDEPALDASPGTPPFSQQALRDFLMSRTGSPPPTTETTARAAVPHAVARQAESTTAPHPIGQTPAASSVDNAPVTEHASELAMSVASALNAQSLAAPRGRGSPRTEAFDTAGIVGSALSTTAATSPLQDPGSPQLTIAPRLDTPEWKAAFAGGVRLLVQEGANSASLQLNPAELGPIDVRIQVTDQRADISFLVKSSDANAAIQSALSDLREQLARSGIELGQTNVGNQREHAQHPGHTPRRGQTQTAPVLPLADASQPAPRHRPSGQIDTFA